MKKRISLAFLFLLLAAPGSAFENPVDQGNFLITMPVVSYAKTKRDASYQTTDESSTFQFMAGGLELGLQYFVLPGLAMGGTYGYSEEKSDRYTLKSTNYGPMIHYYLNLDRQWMPYLGLGYNYEKQKSDNTSIKITSLIVQGGISCMISPHFSIYGEIGYSHCKEKYLEPVWYGEIAVIEYSADSDTYSYSAGLKAFF